MLTRSTVVAGLVGVLVALLITGGFLALDRTALHWYADGDAAGLTATEAEAYAATHILNVGLPNRIEDGWLPTCEARDRSQAGWLVRCGLVHPQDKPLPAVLTYLVADDGSVSPSP